MTRPAITTAGATPRDHSRGVAVPLLRLPRGTVPVWRGAAIVGAVYRESGAPVAPDAIEIVDWTGDVSQAA